MVTKIVALVFVLLATTSGWAGVTARDNDSKYCPLANSWIQLSSQTASIEKSKSTLNLPGQAVHEGKTTALDSGNKY